MCSLLANTTFAASGSVIKATGEFSQDVRFAFLSSNLSASFHNLLGFSFFGASNPSQTQIVSIQMFPGSVTIKQGEKVTFSAIGFDAENEPLNIIAWQWEAKDVGRNLPVRPLQNSTFNAAAIGTFAVSAKSNGHLAQATVTVLPSAAGSPLQPAFSAMPARVISSRPGKANPTAEKQPKQPKDENAEKYPLHEFTANTQNLLPEEGYWNNGNWQSADDPGNQTGNPTGSPADGGAGSGNFQLSAPVISLPGRGIDLALNLNYNSRLWNKAGNELTFDIDKGFPAPGWSLGFGKIVDMGADGGSLLIDADGTRHGYGGSISDDYGGSSVFRGHTADGKFIDYESWRDTDGVYAANAWFPNGTQIYYSAQNEGAVYPVLITDAQGNQIYITYRNNEGPALQTITDTLGRVITFQYDSSGRLLSAKAPMIQGEIGSTKTRILLKLHYKPLTLNHSFGTVITPVVRNPAPQYLLDAVYYPSTGTGYWFGEPDSYSSYGMLAKVIEQRGMAWTTGSETQGVIVPGTMSKQALYNYPLTTANEAGRTNGTGLDDAPTYTTLTESWDGPDVATPAVTTYNFNHTDSHSDGTSNSPCHTTTLTQPNGTVSKQYSYRTPNVWMDGLVFADETIVMNGSTPVTVSSSRVSWAQADSQWGYDSPRPAWAEITDENGKKVKTEYSYVNGRFNQVTRSCDYDDGGNQLKCANAVYENSAAYNGTRIQVGAGNNTSWYFGGGRHIFNLLKISNVENPGGAIASQTEYEYDNYAAQPFVNTPGVIQHYAGSDPFTTQTTSVQGECIQEEEHPYGGYYCVAWNYYDVSVYDPATDKRGNITKETAFSDAQNPNTAISNTSAYDITGNLVKASTSCCQQTSILYDDPNTTEIDTQYAYPYSQTRGSSDPNSPDRVTTYAIYNFETGLLKQTTDANGRTAISFYNPETMRPTKSLASTGAYTLFSYDDTAMTVSEEVFEANNNSAGKTIKYLNGIGQVRKEESPGAGGVLDIVETKYNQIGDVWKQSRPYRSGETPVWSETIYDSQGRVTQSIEPDGSISKAFYNETARPDSASTGIGNTVRVADAWGRERWGRYDQQGRLAEVVEPNPNGNGKVLPDPNNLPQTTGSLKTSYIYDVSGRLTETVQGDQQRKFKYDSLGRLTRQKLAEQTATLNDAGVYVGAGNAGAVWSEAFVYDNRSNLVQKTDARNVKSYYSYTKPSGGEDPLNRIQQVSYDATGASNVLPAPTVTYSYMTTGDKARISQIRTDGFLTETYAYDAESRVSDFTQTVDGRTSYPMQTSYLYDSLDRTKEVRYPKQYGLDPATYGVADGPRKIIEPLYDNASRLATLKVGGQIQASEIVYNAADQTEAVKIGVAGNNQVTETYTYDNPTGLLTQQKAVKNGAELLNLSYDYARNNSVGNQTGKTGHLTKIIDNLNNAKNKEYKFDALGRLTEAKGGNNLWTQNYSYDRYGNRTNVTATGNGIDNNPMPKDGIGNLTYDSTSNRITNSGVQYDVAGNQTRALAEDGVMWLKYEYDAANRLQMIRNDADNAPLQAFQFGSSNQRLMDYDYQYGQLKIIAQGGAVEYTEFTGAIPTWTKSYIYLGDSILSTITPNGTSENVEYNHPDPLGTKLTTNQQTGTSFEQASLPFGTALNAETTRGESKRFTSYERSARTGLDYAVNRTYDSKLGRFTQVDPIGMDSTDLGYPQTFNLYNYCGNDPINHTDPDGLFWGFFKKLIKWAMVAVTVISAVIAIATFNVPAGLGLIKTLISIMGLVAKVANAAQSFLSAIGQRKAANIFGWISRIASGFGNILAKIESVNGTPPTFPFATSGDCPPDCSGDITLGTETVNVAIGGLGSLLAKAVGAVAKFLWKYVAQFFSWVWRGIKGAAKWGWNTVKGWFKKADKPADKTDIKDKTIGKSVRNTEANIRKTDFADNLKKEGYSSSVSKDGKVTVLTKGNRTYTIRDTSKSTGGPTVEVFEDGILTQKIRIQP